MNYYIAPSPCGSVRMRSKWLTDNTDATDFIFFTDFLILRYTWSCFFFRIFSCACTALDIPQQEIIRR